MSILMIAGFVLNNNGLYAQISEQTEVTAVVATSVVAGETQKTLDPSTTELAAEEISGNKTELSTNQETSQEANQEVNQEIIQGTNEDTSLGEAEKPSESVTTMGNQVILTLNTTKALVNGEEMSSKKK